MNQTDIFDLLASTSVSGMHLLDVYVEIVMRIIGAPVAECAMQDHTDPGIKRWLRQWICWNWFEFNSSQIQFNANLHLTWSTGIDKWLCESTFSLRDIRSPVKKIHTMTSKPTLMWLNIEFVWKTKSVSVFVSFEKFKIYLFPFWIFSFDGEVKLRNSCRIAGGKNSPKLIEAR